MAESRMRLTDPDDEIETDEELKQKVKNLKPLIDRANASPKKSGKASSDSASSTPIAIALGLTKEEAEEARAFGFL